MGFKNLFSFCHWHLQLVNSTKYNRQKSALNGLKSCVFPLVLPKSDIYTTTHMVSEAAVHKKFNRFHIKNKSDNTELDIHRYFSHCDKIHFLTRSQIDQIT